jgi:aspartyl-tRNA(Asn)/glutamyl-tRNA(Gln) amidotransferase subunit C
MSPFGPDEVRTLAALARLELSDEETRTFAHQLGDILDFARQVQEADTTAPALIPPPADAVERVPGCVLPPLAPTRDDEVQPSLARDVALSNAPAAEGGLFKVPRVLTE